MRIEKGQKICGIEAKALRDCLGKEGYGQVFTRATFERLLSISHSDAEALISALLNEGFIAEDYGGYVLTEKGNALRMARTGASIKRHTAEKALDEFMKRVAEINEETSFLYLVKRVILFGSLLKKDAEKVNDVDLLVEVESREKDRSQYMRRFRERVAFAKKAGRRFRNIGEKVCWPREEVRLMLQNKSRVLSVEFFDETQREFLEGTEHKVIYELPDG
jgi:predicted nucleotidyltransferase